MAAAMTTTPLLLLLALLAIGCTAQSKAFRSRRIGTEGQVVSRLLADYDSSTRPPVRDHADHSAIVVITNVFINRVKWLGDKAEVDLYLRQQWEDSRLQYEVDAREDIHEVSIPLNRKIWIPDTYFTTGSEPVESKLRSLVVEPSGHVRASERRTVELPVKEGGTFPFIDKKSFTIRLSSYVYPLEDIVYLWANSPPLVNPVEVSNDLLTGSFVFEEASAGDCVGNYTVGEYSCVDVTVTFDTGYSGSMMSCFVPSLLLLIASWLHFWIHGSWSVPRSLSAALPFFIFAGLFVFARERIISCGYTCWLSFCLILTFFSFVEYFIVICCGIRRSIRYKTNGNPAELPMGAANETLEVNYDTRCASFKNNNGVDVLARILFPLITVIFLILYIFVFA